MKKISIIACCLLATVLCEEEARQPVYKYKYETEDVMKTAASTIPIHGYHVVEGGYYPAAAGGIGIGGAGLGGAGIGVGGAGLGYGGVGLGYGGAGIGYGGGAGGAGLIGSGAGLIGGGAGGAGLIGGGAGLIGGGAGLIGGGGYGGQYIGKLGYGAGIGAGGIGAGGIGIGGGAGGAGIGYGPIGYGVGVKPIGLIGGGAGIGGAGIGGAGIAGAGIGGAGIGLGGGQFIGGGGAVGPIGYGGGYIGGIGGEVVDKNVYSGGKKNLQDGKFEKIEGKKGEIINNGQEGYTQGKAAVKDVKGDTGYYNEAEGGKKVFEDEKAYHGAQKFNKEAKNEGEKKIQQGHKKGHVIKGFKSSHHKDESGKTEEYYDEENDEGNHFNFAKEGGEFAENAGSAFKGGHEDDKFNAGQAKKEGHYANEHFVDNNNGGQGQFGAKKYLNNGEVYGVNNGIDEASLQGHHESSRFYKHHPHVPFY